MNGSMPRFSEYTRAELQEVAQAFLRELRGRPETWDRDYGTRAWTELVLNYFAATRALGVRVDASRPAAKPRGGEWIPLFADLPARETEGEFLFDMTHTSWPEGDHRGKEYWLHALQQPSIDMLLALESENGHSRQAEANVVAIMDDSAKLLHVAARVKVMVFASINEQQRGEILQLAKALVLQDRSAMAGESPTWLWLDLPWSQWTNDFGPGAWLSGEAGERELVEVAP